MSEQIQNVIEKLKKTGYYASPELAKMIVLFEAAGKRNPKNIPTLLLQGPSGAGKTYLAEMFSKMIGADEKFVQCFPRMGTENFLYDVNIEAVIKQESDNSIKPGILLQAIEQSKESPVVLVIDELDKARPDVDSFLLDFLENGRLTTGTDTYEKGEYPIYTFITSNAKREIDEALKNRSRIVNVPRPYKELFLEILGLPKNHYLGYVYDKIPEFSIRQAKQYLEDLEILGQKFDVDALSQYINIDKLEVRTISDIQTLDEMGNNHDLEVELENFQRCKININDRNMNKFASFLQSEDRKKFELLSHTEYDTDIDLCVDTIEQLELLQKYIDFEDYFSYSGWFKCSFDEEESKSIIWANTNDRNKIRLGLKIVGENVFKVFANRGQNFVYLSSERREGKSLRDFKNEKNNEKNNEKFSSDDFVYGE